MATESEQLILRGLNIIMRTTFAPNDPAAQAKHFADLTADIGPWFVDYAAEIAKPAEEFRTIVREVTDVDGNRHVETNGPTDTAVIVEHEPKKSSALDLYDHECIPGN